MESYKIAFVIAIGAFLTNLVLADPTPSEPELEERQGFIESLILTAIVGASTGILKGVLGPEKPGCTFDPDGDPNNQWWARAFVPGEDGVNRTIAEICWTGGGYSITEDDVAVVDCLMDLHVNQQTTCIDTVGSSCDIHPGTGVGSVRNIHDLDTSSGQQIDAFSADRTKAAFAQMINREHGFDIGSYVNIYPMNDDGTYTSWAIQVIGTGGEDC